MSINMKTKIQQKIIGLKIKSYDFLKTYSHRKGKPIISGIISLENNTRIRVENGKYLILDSFGSVTGFIPKTNPGFKIIKRIIASVFKTYRKGEKGGVGHHVAYWKSRAIDGLHNYNLFLLSDIKFKEHPTNFLRLAS